MDARISQRIQIQPVFQGAPNVVQLFGMHSSTQRSTVAKHASTRTLCSLFVSPSDFNGWMVQDAWDWLNARTY
jgi:hypothetical protein